MALPSPDAIAAARKRVEQAKVRLDALNRRVASEGRRLDTRRKIILGGLLLDAAAKDPAHRALFDALMARITRDADRAAFASWTLPVPPARDAR